MEKAREVATARSRHQAKVIKFATQGVTGLERRVARQGDQGLMGYILEMLAEYAGTISDGRITLTEDTLRVWALDDSCFRSMTEAYYVPFDGMEDKVTAKLTEILHQAEKIWALVPRLQRAFSEGDSHGDPLSVTKVLHLLNNNTALVQWAKQVQANSHHRVACSWYYAFPRATVSVEDMCQLCDDVIQAVYPRYSLANKPSDRTAAWTGTPIFQLGGLLTRAECNIADGGFNCSSKTTERIGRVLYEFGVDYIIRESAMRKMSSGHAIMHGTGTAMICYANDRDKERGKLSVLPLARWLRSFGYIEDATIQKVVNALRVGTIEYLHSYEQWYDAYLNARDFSSCMSHHSGYYEIFDDGVPYAPCGSSLPLHPIWCYAEHEHLRLAVIRRGDEIVARAIVNNSNMQYYRVYGDYALAAALRMSGYSEDADYLDGVTLRSRVVDGRHILHPYVDGNNHYADIEMLGDDDVLLHLNMCGDIEVQNTEGGARYYNAPEQWCEVCECYHRDGGNTVYDSDGDAIYDVCDNCYDNACHAYDANDRLIRNVAAGHYGTCELSDDYYLLSALEYNDDLDMMVSASALQKWKESQEDEEEE